MNRYPKHSTKETQIRAEMRQIRLDNQQILRRRHEKGDRTLRLTLLGNIREKQTQVLTIESAEGLRFAYTQTTLRSSLPQGIGETVLNTMGIDESEPPETTHIGPDHIPTTDTLIIPNEQ